MPAATSILIRSLRTSRHALRALSSAAFLESERLSTWKLGSLQSIGNSTDLNFGAKDPWGTAWWFAAVGLLAFCATPLTRPTAAVWLQEKNDEDYELPSSNKRPRVIFVLGGPGSGKGTQCAKIVNSYGFTHLSAGDLLRAEINSGSENGTMIQNTIKEGKIVPSEVTVKLIQKAMSESDNDKFLIDGFPRNEENRSSFEAVTGIEPEFILFFDCPVEEMEKRLLSRNQGRVDDNIETIRKRFKVFIESSLPVVQYYEAKGKVRKINASLAAEEVFKSIQSLFVPFIQEDLVQSTKELLQSIDMGDYETYKKLCDPTMTAFEPEAQGHLVEGLDFHKFYFDLRATKLPALAMAHSEISSPKVLLIGDKVGLVTYTRLCQKEGSNGFAIVEAFNETRVWEHKKSSTGQWVWKNVHFHRSRTPIDE